MFRTLFLMISFNLATFGLLWGQAGTTHCGVEGEALIDLTERLLQNKASLYNNPYVQQRDIIFIPVTYQLVGQSNGAGRATERQVLEVNCALNDDFADMNIQFYIKQINYINNAGIYDNPGTATTVMNVFKDPASMNIWVTNTATTPYLIDIEGVLQGYYFSGERIGFPPYYFDWIVIRKSAFNANSSVLTHELGHFFSLIHPHNGWEPDAWQPGDPSPVSATSPGGVPTELQSGANCEDAGDYVCDTPPDYNGIYWQDCNYVGAQDPEGVLIDPDESNFMSYFDFCPREEYHFSEMQKSLMLQELNANIPQRNYINSNNVPDLAEINETATLVSPAQSEFVPGYNAVNFQWSPVAGADRYLLEIDNNTDWSGTGYEAHIVFGASKIIELEGNRTYNWRVTPFSPYRTCMTPSAPRSFSTGNTVAVDEIREVSRWSVDPNPARIGGQLNVRLEATESFAGQIRLFSLNGQLVRDGGRQRFVDGNNLVRLPLQGLNSGVYLLSLQTGDKQLTARVVLAQ